MVKTKEDPRSTCLLPSLLFLWPRLFFQPVDHMSDSQQGMMPYHAGPGIPHNLADILPQLRLIAMDRAVAAGCLVFLKRTVFKPESCVFNQLLAFVAEFIPPCGVLPFCMMMIPAVDTDHVFNSFLLSFHPGVHSGTNFFHSCFAMAIIYSAIFMAG